ncbi:MAG: hypothetical protein AVDCRST_MAG68-2091, partial [uncultured Gemmatimonadetes bacterium]
DLLVAFPGSHPAHVRARPEHPADPVRRTARQARMAARVFVSLLRAVEAVGSM